jgi:hypothetical protein
MTTAGNPEIRVITENLPSYKFPYASILPSMIFGYTLIQARGEDRVWEPRWCLVDMEGTALAIFEADSFDNLDADAVAQAASEFIMDMHELSEDETGNAVSVEHIHGDNESQSFEIV